jgi:hypothetical protein
VLVARSLEAPDLMASLAAAADSGSFTPAGWDGSVYRVEIERIFASSAAQLGSGMARMSALHEPRPTASLGATRTDVSCR